MLQSRPANIEGRGAVTMLDLTRMALRMDPDRVIVGEVRGGEAFPMLLAMSQGNNGSMCTIHADATRTVFPKLAAYVAMADTGLPVETVNLLIATAVHFVVFIDVVDGVRRLAERARGRRRRWRPHRVERGLRHGPVGLGGARLSVPVRDGGAPRRARLRSGSARR